MREILFRGKRLDNGEWVEGCFGQHTSLDAFIIVRPYPAMSGGWDALGFYEVDPATVGQYTGLRDRNGSRIFEGDVVKWAPVYGIQIEVVSFEEGGFGAGKHFLQSGLYAGEFEGEVIGNIHDNPELLEIDDDGGGDGVEG